MDSGRFSTPASLSSTTDRPMHRAAAPVGAGLQPAPNTAAVRKDPGLFAGLIAAARADGRVVAEQSGLVALVPPAPRQPYEAWIVTEAEQPHFHAAKPEAVHALADLTRELAARLHRIKPGCHYNWWLHQAPFRMAGEVADGRGWHWHVEVLPRLAEIAGFEIGTGCHITTLSAEDSARHLRDAAS